ncbi:MAG: hypothetical protein NT072_01860 [Deltaproteobacteria bacterium]|nr:hypothetical protein [Deltaproteobacteria bacterium]
MSCFSLSVRLSISAIVKEKTHDSRMPHRSIECLDGKNDINGKFIE